MFLIAEVAPKHDSSYANYNFQPLKYTTKCHSPWVQSTHLFKAANF